MDIKSIIQNNGPISVAEFMGVVLPEYYSKRQPFGKGGDFTTAPEISQVFGELIGVCIASQWMGMGNNDSVNIVELGPGRGTLMKDFLRGTRHVQGFHESIEVHMVENSKTLQDEQKKNLEGQHHNISWHEKISDVPRKKTFFIANEFFDALPIRQYEKTNRGWCERLVCLGAKDELEFGLSDVTSLSEEFDKKHPDAKEGAFIEISQASIAIASDIAKTVSEFGGGGVFIDYGYDYYGYKDTLQGLRNHKYNDVLKNVGEADITAHVDFVELSNVIERHEIDMFNVMTQRHFLLTVGIIERKEMLLKNITDNKKAKKLNSEIERLIDTENMGNLFKVLMFVK